MKLYTVHVKWQKRVTAFLLMISILTGIIACNPLQTEAGVYIHDLYGVKDFDLSIYRADNYLKNDCPSDRMIKDMMRFSYPSQTLVDDLNKSSFQKKVDQWKKVHMVTKPSNGVKDQLDEKGYYEAIILSVFVSQTDNKNYMLDCSKKVSSEVNATFKAMKKVMEESDKVEMSKISKNQILSHMTSAQQEEIRNSFGGEFAKNHPDIDDGEFLSDNLKIYFESASTLEKAIERLCTYTQLCELSQQQIAVLKKHMNCVQRIIQL